MFMQIALRPACPDDFNFCARLYFRGMADTIRQLKLDMSAQSEHLRNRWNVIEVEIITCDGADVGWLQSSTRDDVFYLEQIFIDVAFQRRGIGTEIISGIIEKAGRDRKTVTLGVVKTNPAQRLYQRLGFRRTGEDDRKFYLRHECD